LSTRILWHAQFLIVLVPNLGHGLTEIHGYAPVIHQHIVHFQVRFSRLLLGGEFTKGVLQRLPRRGIANNLHLDGGIESGKDQFQIFIDRDGIEFATKEDRIGGSDFSTGQVSEHFENNGATVILFAQRLFLLLSELFHILLGLVQIHFPNGNSDRDSLFGRPVGWGRVRDHLVHIIIIIITRISNNDTPFGQQNLKPGWIRKGIVNDQSSDDANIGIRASLGIAIRRSNLIENSIWIFHYTSQRQQLVVLF
jgi:hypothetical protein